MDNPVLQRGSMFRDEVARLQLALREAGFSIEVDGTYGSATEKAVAELQGQHQLEADGIVGEGTWQLLEELGKKDEESLLESTELMPGFRGDLAWIHQWQGHVGGPYWPGGAVGITLDPGIDLGHTSLETVTDAYRQHLDDDAWQVIETMIGVRGETAQEQLRKDPVLRGIEIDRETACTIFPHAADPVWRDLLRRLPGLSREETPPEVQTALLSLALDHGAVSSTLEGLRGRLAKRDWQSMADTIAPLDEHHRLDRIHRRRQAEAELIRQAAD